MPSRAGSTTITAVSRTFPLEVNPLSIPEQLLAARADTDGASR